MRLAILAFLFVSAAANTANITCNYNTHAWPYIGEVYFCSAPLVRVYAPNTIIEHITPVPDGTKTFDDVKLLSIWNQVCHYVPKNLELFFKNIELLEIGNSQLVMITKSDLKAFESLVSLWLQGNLLTFLQPELFTYSTKLKYVDLSKNHFKTIPAEIFNVIEDLEQIKILDNFCISSHAHNREQVYEVKREIIQNCQGNATRGKIDNEVASLSEQVSELKKSNENLQSVVKNLTSEIDALTTF